jgi:hypothetical protein
LSAALQFPLPQLCAGAAAQPTLLASAIHQINRHQLPKAEPELARKQDEEPLPTWAFYRKHTENLLRRYLYASVQVGRSPNLLGESVGRGWVSSRRVRTFEDALIFVLDVERCLNRLSLIDRQIISRVVLQEYTQAEAAVLLGTSSRTICNKLPKAIDRLTEDLVASNLLTLPN